MAASLSSLSPRISLLLLLFLGAFWFVIEAHALGEISGLKGVGPGDPVLNVSLIPLVRKQSVHGVKEVISCERVQVSGYSRTKMGKYANSFRVKLAPTATIPERLHSKIQACFHRNASLGMCECEKDDWRTLQKGLWSSVMSPYDKKYIDVKFGGESSGSVSISVEEDFQQWRLVCLLIGFIMLLIAPIVSSWLPFYYSSSMAVGVFLVILILLFQGMKLLPTGRKNFLYLAFYGSVLGAGSFILHQFSVMVNMILISFGLSEDMYNPVAVLVFVGIIIAGAALGFWTVRKFVISADGGVDASVAQFVKWAMRTIATTFIFQSTLDTPLAMGALVASSAFCFLISKMTWKRKNLEYQTHRQLVSGKKLAKHGRVEFLSRSSQLSPGGRLWSSPRNVPSFSDSPVGGMISPSSSARRRRTIQRDFYSTYHKTPNRKKFTKKEWEELTRESTREAMAGLAASPEFTDWVIEHADRIQLLPSESSDDTVGSESDSTGDDVFEKWKRFGLSGW
ncbi:PREDICTED: uncharacterized protein LOC104821409 isoform X2 [Tarenaya hassleriana]|uniref:uncharacterized protein LOC104821409 isoform X2 n=1 Tax=Tarenaya hassleriana TaxID=28532 RepID=UPI00053C6FBF|nr:PREDICTED: uncharacterized protein LOC104821409 isoform X2 [Tarenaya hassleriana]